MREEARGLSERGDLAARFAALARHPDAERAIAAVSTSPGRATELATALLLLVVLLVVGLLLALGLSMFFPPLAVVPVVVVAIGTVLIVQNAVRTLRAPEVPELRGLALVADEHTRFSDDPGGPSVTARPAVTLEFRDGSRREFLLAEELTGTLAAGDMGVVTLRGERLIGFQRFDA